MIRIFSEHLPPGSMPLYDTDPATEVALYDAETAKVHLISRTSRFIISEAELSVLGSTAENAVGMLKAMLAKTVASFCRVGEGTLLLPHRGITVVSGSGPGLNAYIYFGMAILLGCTEVPAGSNPEELGLPLEIDDVEEYGAEVERIVCIHEVMET